jgi:hypothetical protein
MSKFNTNGLRFAIIAILSASFTLASIAGCSPCLIAFCGVATFDYCVDTCIFTPSFPACLVACAGVHCIPCIVACACYDEHTTVTLANGKVVAMSTLLPGDIVQTLDESLELTNTTVTSIHELNGNFSGIAINTQKATLKVTREHEIRVLRPDSGTTGIPAWKARENDMVVEQSNGASQVKSIYNHTIFRKISLVTTSCTILANGILTETC